MLDSFVMDEANILPPINQEPLDISFSLGDGPIMQDRPPADTLICENCGTSFAKKPGPGRNPKRCEDCRNGKTSNTSTADPAVKAKSGRTVDILVKQIDEFYKTIGVVISFAQPKDGQTIAEKSTSLAESWRPLLEKDPKIRAVWTKILTGSGWGTVVMAHAVIAIPIMQNHGINLNLAGLMGGGK